MASSKTGHGVRSDAVANADEPEVEVLEQHPAAGDGPDGTDPNAELAQEGLDDVSEPNFVLLSGEDDGDRNDGDRNDGDRNDGDRNDGDRNDGEKGDPEDGAAPVPVRPARRSSRSLAVRDPLQAYINEARRYPLLSREDEHEFAVAFQERGDVDAARHLVTANLRLVVKIAHEYRKAYRNILDLVQEGNIGLMHAVKKFDPYRGVKLSSYAAWWIRAYILKFILNNWRLVKIGTTQHQRKLFFNLHKEMDRLEQMGIDDPTPKLLAERLDVPEYEVRSMQARLSGGDVSLDAPLHAEDGASTSRLDMVASTDAGPDARVEEEQFSSLLRKKVREFGTRLDGRDKEIFELRTVAAEPLTLQQVGDKYGITRERARQIERRVMDRLRDFLKEELGDSVDVALGLEES